MSSVRGGTRCTAVYALIVIAAILTTVGCGANNASRAALGTNATADQSIDGAALLSPANGALEVTLSTTLTWTKLANAQSYRICLGSAAGKSDVLDSGNFRGTSLEVGPLADSTKYFVRLWTMIGGKQAYSDSTFTTISVAHLTIFHGSNVIDGFQPFTWTPAREAASYYIYVGSAPGRRDIFDSAELPARITSRTVSGLLPDSQYYARLHTKKQDGAWYHEDVAFRTAPADPVIESSEVFHSKVQQLTAAVRAMAPADNTPVPGSELAQEAAIWGRNYALCSDYANVLLKEFAAHRVYARFRAITTVGNFQDWHAVTEYYDVFQSKWSVADGTFGVVYFDDAAQTGQSVDDLSQIVVAQDWGAIHVKPVTTVGDAYMRSYYLDPVLLFLNPVLPEKSPVASAINSAMPYLLPIAPGDIGQAPGTYLVQFASPTDRATFINGEAKISLFPVDGSSWSAPVVLSPGWSVGTDLPEGSKIYRYNRFLF